jgi:hypothetical protein
MPSTPPTRRGVGGNRSLHVAAKTSGSSKTRAMKDAYNERQKELDDFTREVPATRASAACWR